MSEGPQTQAACGGAPGWEGREERVGKVLALGSKGMLGPAVVVLEDKGLRVEAREVRRWRGEEGGSGIVAGEREEFRVLDVWRTMGLVVVN